MKSKRIGKGIAFRAFIAPEAGGDAEFAQHEQREWEDPLRPVFEMAEYWSNWLTERSLPTVGLFAVSDDLVWRVIMRGGPEPDETVMTAYQYLQRRFEPLSDEALAGKVAECAFMAFSPKEEWETAGYDVRHTSEAAFRMACIFELGWVLKELELRGEPSPSGFKNRKTGKKYSIQDDIHFGASARGYQSEGGKQRAAGQSVADNGVVEVERRVEAGKGLNEACQHVAKSLGIPWNTLKSRVSSARQRKSRKKLD